MAALSVKTGGRTADPLDAPWSGVVRSVAHGRLRRMVGHAYEAPLGDDNV